MQYMFDKEIEKFLTDHGWTRFGFGQAWAWSRRRDDGETEFIEHVPQVGAVYSKGVDLDRPRMTSNAETLIAYYGGNTQR